MAVKKTTRSKQTKVLPVPGPQTGLSAKEILKRKFLDRCDLEEVFKISRGTFYNKQRKGFFIPIDMDGRIYYDMDDLLAMGDAHKVYPKPKK